MTVRADWFDSKRNFLTPDLFNVTITFTSSFDDLVEKGEVKQEDIRRLVPKIRLVEASAARRAVAMLKGTLKYTDDNNTVDQWFAHMMDELDDQSNYMDLLQQKRLEDTDGS